MSQVSIIINVRNHEHSHSNGLTGTYVVPPKPVNEPFSMLVIYPQQEIQDQGDRRSKVEVVEAKDIARSIIGYGSDAGQKEKWGLLLCAAEPDMPKELETAIREERLYLNKHRPEVKYVKDQENGAIVAENHYRPGVAETLEQMSTRVRSELDKFEAACKKMVTKAEISKAVIALQMEDQSLVAQGDRIWAGPEPGRININELHKDACVRLGQERPWCYIPQQLVDCPGCGAKIKENVLSCAHCAGWLDEGIPELMAMKPRDRAMKMYPERYAEPVTASGQKSARA